MGDVGLGLEWGCEESLYSMGLGLFLFCLVGNFYVGVRFISYFALGIVA